MNPPDDKAQDIERREQELKAREHALRLRELEAEVNQPPSYQTRKHQKPNTSLQPLSTKMVKVAAFVGTVVAVVITIKIATQIAYWLGSVLLVSAVAWVAYKIFFESDRSQK